MQHEKQEQARHMYFAQAKTQKEIALALDVSEKTIYNWIKRHSWDQLRQAARQAPALISENLCSHIVELQNSIARREPGTRYPTDEESKIMQRLISMLEKMKKFPGLAMNMQVMTTFSNWMSSRNKDFTRDLSIYSGLFLEGYAKNGYYPYEMEFGMDKISPIDPYYVEEPFKEEPKPEPASTAPAEKTLPVNLPADTLQLVENQPLPLGASADKPEKTGKTKVNPDRSDDFPWRKWLPELLQQRNANQSSNNTGTPKRE